LVGPDALAATPEMLSGIDVGIEAAKNGRFASSEDSMQVPPNIAFVSPAGQNLKKILMHYSKQNESIASAVKKAIRQQIWQTSELIRLGRGVRDRPNVAFVKLDPYPVIIFFRMYVNGIQILHLHLQLEDSRSLTE
jgi:plasmid stabilization system protein ParE